MCQKDTVFSYSQDNERDSRIFPIDYTLKDFSNLIKSGGFFHQESKNFVPPRGCDPRTIKNNFLNHPLLKSTLENMHYSNINSAHSPELNNVPIPFEAGPFLACIHKLELSIEEPTISDDQLRDLFENLYEIIASFTDDHDINKYYRHVLFQNEWFVNEVLGRLWAHEMTQRFERLKKEARLKPFEQQIYILMECLMTLDQCILKLGQQKEERLSRTTVEPNEIIRQTLVQLLSMRKKDTSTQNIHAVYLINNSDLDDGSTLKDAFDRLKKTSTKDKNTLLNAARQAYIKNLVLNTEAQATHSQAIHSALELESKYMFTRLYLDTSSFQMNEKELGDAILGRCIYKCRNILNFCDYSPYVKVPPFSGPNLYNSELIDRLIGNKFNQEIRQFYETIKSIIFLSVALTGAISQIISLECSLLQQDNTGKSVDDLISKLKHSSLEKNCNENSQEPSLLERSKPHLEAMWHYISEKSSTFSNMDIIKFLCDGSEIAGIFEKEDWKISKKRALELIRFYNTNTTKILDMEYCDAMLNLLRLSFLLVLKKISFNVTSFVMEEIKRLAE